MTHHHARLIAVAICHFRRSRRSRNRRLLRRWRRWWRHSSGLACLHLIVDSTGLSIVGDGAWAAATHGGRGRRGWKKLHLGVDGSRVIVACALTEPTADDAITGSRLVDEVDGHLTRVTADPAYDTLAFYGAAGARGARCQGRSKSRPRWRRKSRPPSRWGGVAEGGLRTPGRLRGAGPSCCGQDDSSRRSAPGCGRDGSAGRAGRRSAVRSRRSPSIR